MRTKPRLRLAIVGWGAMAHSAARLLEATPVEIVAVATRGTSGPPEDLPTGALLIHDPAELPAIGADVVAEAASRDSVGPWGRAALHAGADFIVSSVSALADADLLASLRHLAEENSTHVHIHSGALGGVDALSAARAMGLDAVDHRIIKPPGAWRGTPAESLCALDRLDQPERFFQGTAAEAATTFPKNANVAMTVALAGIGPDRTTVTLIADPAAATNRHEISARGGFGQLDVAIANRPLPDNPKTSAMAALNLARSIENRAAPIVV